MFIFSYLDELINGLTMNILIHELAVKYFVRNTRIIFDQLFSLLPAAKKYKLINFDLNLIIIN